MWDVLVRGCQCFLCHRSRGHVPRSAPWAGCEPTWSFSFPSPALPTGDGGHHHGDRLRGHEDHHGGHPGHRPPSGPADLRLQPVHACRVVVSSQRLQTGSAQGAGGETRHPGRTGHLGGKAGTEYPQGLSCSRSSSAGAPFAGSRRCARTRCDSGMGWDTANSNGDVHPLPVLADRQRFGPRVTGGIPLPRPSPDHPHLHRDHPHLLRDHPDGVRAWDPFPPCRQRGPLLAWAPGKQGHTWPSPPCRPTRTGGSQWIGDQIPSSPGPPLSPLGMEGVCVKP